MGSNPEPGVRVRGEVGPLLSHLHIWRKREEIAPGIYYEAQVSYTGDDNSIEASDFEEFGLGTGWVKIA